MTAFTPNIKFLRKVQAGEVQWISSRGWKESKFVGGLKTAEAHHDAGLCSYPHAGGPVRLTDAGRAVLDGGQVPGDTELKLF